MTWLLHEGTFGCRRPFARVERAVICCSNCQHSFNGMESKRSIPACPFSGSSSGAPKEKPKVVSQRNSSTAVLLRFHGATEQSQDHN